MKKFRSERYITQIKNKNGWSFRVRYKGMDKFFNENDFGDPRIAFNKAVDYRNSLIDTSVVYLAPFSKTIYDVLLESFDLLVVRQKTRKNHLSLFNTYIKDHILVSNFTESFAYSKLNAMVETCNDDTISRVFNILNRIDRVCLINHYYDRSVMMSVVCPKTHIIAHRQFKEPITKQQLDQIISACESLKNEHRRKQFPLILEFLYLTGCRPCEVWCLTWEDVSRNYISINKEVGSDNSHTDIVRPTKTALSNRLLPITPQMRTLLKKAENGSALIFPQEDGSMYDTDLIGRHFKKIANSVGIDFNMYDLRHRFATDLTLNKVDDRTKMELMGHKNISMTLDYARSNDNAKKQALIDRP